MKKGKIIKRALMLIVIFVLAYVIRYAWVSFPIITGYGAKNLCSCMFVGGRDEKNVIKEELGAFPLSLASYEVDTNNSSVTATVFGLAKHKAIYRKGLGCTLINELTEDEIRKQQFTTANTPQVDADTINWPMGDRLQDSTPSNIDLQKMDKVLNGSLKENDPKYFAGTRAIVVLYDGKLVAEKYAAGYNRHSKMLGWSMTKSVTAALIGILVKEGKLQPSLPAPVPEWKDPSDSRHAITLANLLHQASGLQFEENYDGASNATNMLFRKADMAAYTASMPLKDKPGSVFYYSSGNSNIISRIVRKTVGEKEYHRFPANALFNKTGMYSAVMEPDASGTFVGSSYMYATARDWARFGLLYYNDGIFNNERILPEGWVKETATPFATDTRKQYGYQFWLNGLDKTDQAKRKYPDVPADMFYADGFGGQGVYIIPSKKLVVVRLGLHNIDDNELLKNVIGCFK
jgi:CubicO group peptidase (beta-lactamase class C family)